MKYGAIHAPLPTAIQPFGARARLSLMEVPAAVDWAAKCPADGNALGNDRVGNCVPVAMLRAIQMRRAIAWGDAWAPDEQEAVGLYSLLAGYDPITGAGNVGTNTVDAMTHWCKSGIITTQQALDVPQWVSVSPRASRYLKVAIDRTGPVQFTIAVPPAVMEDPLNPDAWLQQPGQGAGWAMDQSEMHRILGVGYDGDFNKGRTWGHDYMIHPALWNFIAVGCDVTLSRQWFDTVGRAPDGLDWDAVEGDMLALAA